MIVLITVACMTVLMMATCSLLETVLLSTRAAVLEAHAGQPERGAAATRLLELKRNISAPVSALLILNTIANTGGATVAGIYAADALGPSGIVLFSAVFSLAILAFSEITPKTLATVYWRHLWPFIVRPLRIMIYALYPAIVVSRWFTNLLTRGRKAQAVTEDEILALVRIGAREGEITNTESQFVHNIIALENKPVKEIMTPRTVMFALDAGLTVREALNASDQRGFTRIPIYEGDRENIIGYVIRHELLSAKALDNMDAPIKPLAKPISFTPETSNSLALLTNSLKLRRHIQIVVDEYGGVSGVVTLEDLLETLLGEEIVDETDKAVDLQEIARSRRQQRPTV